MAFIPDEAIRQMNQVSAGAWRLYCFLSRCRNQKTGKCCPSVDVTMEAVGIKRRHVYGLRKELAEAGWAKFDGDNATELLGFSSAKPCTSSAENCTESAKNNTSQCKKQHPKVQKMTLAYKEEPAKEPAKIILPSVEADAPPAKSGKLKPPVPPAVAYIRHLTQRYPDKTLWPRIVSTLGDDFDGERLTSCYENWVSHGWNKMNLVWLFEWYTKGIPERENQNGRHQKPGKETPNQRNARELDELIYQSLAPSGGFEPPDKPDPGDEGLAVAFRRL